MDQSESSALEVLAKIGLQHQFLWQSDISKT